MRKRAKNYKKWFAARVTHGFYIGGKEKPEHYIWREMLRRCKEQHKSYEHVKVCKRWLKFENFIADMGLRPTTKHSLDRFPDNNGNYNASNCRWATAKQQARNKRHYPRYKQDGQIGTLVEWSDTLKTGKQVLHWRWKNWGTFIKGRKWCELPNRG